MNLIPANLITIQERQRKECPLDKIAELADSIQKAGLINAPVCRHGENDEVVLVAGERRLRAMSLLHEQARPFTYLHTPIESGLIPFYFYEELDPIKAKEVELEENVARLDLTWQERAVAIAELHKIKTQLNPSWTQSDTAEQVSGSREDGSRKVRDRILLAENLHRTELRGAKTEKEAMKILTKSLEDEFRTKLGMMQSAVSTKGMTLQQADAIEYLGQFQSAIDVFCMDPPYGIDADKIDAEMVVKHQYKDDWPSVSALMQSLAKATMRAAKVKAHLYMFCDVRRFMNLFGIFNEAGWEVWPKPIVWVKDVGHIPRPHYGPRYNYETILYANKGERCVTALYSDVIVVPAEKDKEHAAQKPVDVFVNLLRRSIGPGDVVMDPFCGSGTIFAAAHQLQLTAYGCDSDPASVAMAGERIKRLV